MLTRIEEKVRGSDTGLYHGFEGEDLRVACELSCRHVDVVVPENLPQGASVMSGYAVGRSDSMGNTIVPGRTHRLIDRKCVHALKAWKVYVMEERDGVEKFYRVDTFDNAPGMDAVAIEAKMQEIFSDHKGAV